MTIVKAKSSPNGGAYLISRSVKSLNGPRIDWKNSLWNDSCRVLVSFNTKDDLELKMISSSDGHKDKETLESYKIEEIIECHGADVKESNNVLVFDVLKSQTREEIVLKFDNEQECRRTLFTYKYFKMRNRLTSSSSSASSASSSNDSSSEGSSSPSLSNKSRSADSNYAKVFDYATPVNNKHPFPMKKFDDVFAFKSLDYTPTSQKSTTTKSSQDQKVEDHKYDLMQITDNNGVTHMSVENKSGEVLGEIDGLIYTDVDYDGVDFANSSGSEALDQRLPQKPQRRKQPLRRIKGKAPPPPTSNATNAEVEVIKGQVVKVSMERQEPAKQQQQQKDANSRTGAPLAKGHIAGSGYESDREEWRSRSTFSSSAFHSLARPARRALAAYYRLSSIPTTPNQPVAVTPASGTMSRKLPSPRNPKALQAPHDFQPKAFHPEYVIVPQQQQQQQQQQDHKYGKALFQGGGGGGLKEYRRNPLSGSMTYLNISNRLYGLTDKLKEFSGGVHGGVHNNQNRHSVWNSSRTDKETRSLKPVIKKSANFEGSKRPVVRTCSNEPPKKVTFSAFATVQVV